MPAASTVLRIARWSAFFVGVFASAACAGVDLPQGSRMTQTSLSMPLGAHTVAR
jgi:hypothetical protein